ncbi:3-dehydroquinate synthase [Pedobacter immunditicola]|uniref:3-dehydroquinate synthase n=1 Tax=Pedobacter immunditicola TaxID=3133440 RepID=UPI0030985864
MSYLEQSFSVSFQYRIFFTTSIFKLSNPMLSNFFIVDPSANRKILFVVDQQVAEAHPHLLNEIKAYFQHYNNINLVQDILIVPGGEVSKNEVQLLDQVIETVNKYGVDRHSYIAAIGGGAVLDMVGFAATVAHRGIKHIRIPTTVLSQNDSGIGVKNGVNYKGKKNFLGTFSPPAAVFNDNQFLSTLSDRDYRSGIAEAIKVALIKDHDFFLWIESHAESLGKRNVESMDFLIKRCAQLHLEHIGGTDPFETGSARPLDFGHWSAHKIEQLSDFTITHGEAVAMGIALDSAYSYLLGWLSEEKLLRILNLLGNLSFDIINPHIQINDLAAPVLQGLTEFQEHLGGKLTITLLTDLGQKAEVHEMQMPLLVEASRYILAYVHDRAITLKNNY